MPQTQTLNHRWMSPRGTILPMVGVIVIALGVYSITAPAAARVIALEQLEMDMDHQMTATAMGAIEMGRSLMWYDTPQTFLQKLQAPPNNKLTLPTTPTNYNVWNGFNVELTIEDNDDGDGNIYFDKDLTLQMVARVWQQDTGGNTIRQAKIARSVTVSTAGKYNFASTKFNGPASLASRDWFGYVHMSSPNNSIWGFSGTQYFHGTLESTTLGSSQSAHQFVATSHYDANGNLVRDTFYNDSQATTLGKLKQYATQAALFAAQGTPPQGPTITAELAAGGMIRAAADSKGLTMPAGNYEVFLAPNGEVWTRPFGGTAGMYNAATNANGWKVLKDNTNTPVQQDGSTILFQGNILLRGFVTGQVTIATTDKAIINGNIRNLDMSHNHLGLVAQNAIMFENRTVYNSNGTNYIRSIRPVDGSSGASSYGTANGTSMIGGQVTAATLDDGSANGANAINGTTVNFIAKPVFDANQVTALSNGSLNGSTLQYSTQTKDPATGAPVTITTVIDSTTRSQIVVPTASLYQSADATGGSIPGRLGKNNSILEASMASGILISPAIPYSDFSGSTTVSSSWLRNNQGGQFRVRGTYLMNVGIDIMGTWSNSSGKMIYDQHPNQLLTVPKYFIANRNTYPSVVYGSWKRLQ